MTETYEIKCAKCNVALKGPANPQGHDRINCPRCGNGDTLEHVMAEVKEQMAEEVSDAFGRSLESIFRGSENVKLAKASRPRKPHRFVIDFHLR